MFPKLALFPSSVVNAGRWTCYRVSDHWVQRTRMAFDKWTPLNRNIPTLYTPWWEEIQFSKHSLKKLKMMVILQNNNHTHLYIRLLTSTLWHPVVCSVSNVLENPKVSIFRSQKPAVSIFSISYNGSSRFIQRASTHLPDYMASHPTRQPPTYWLEILCWSTLLVIYDCERTKVRYIIINQESWNNAHALLKSCK